MPSLNTKLASAPNVSANYVLKATTSTTIGNSLIYDDGTNVGIGTTSPAGIIDVQKNQNATTNFYFRNTNTTDTNSRAYLNIISGNVTTSLQAINNDHSYLNCTNNLYFQIGSNTLFYNGGSEKMRLTSAGRLAIGRTSPGTALSVAGQSEAWQLALSYDTNAGAVIGSPAANVLAFGDWSGTERMRISSAGYVGIGTNNPQDKFVVDGGNNIWTGVFRGTSTTSQSFGVQIFAGTNTSDTALRILNAATTNTLFFVRGDGLVQTGNASGSPYNNTTATGVNLAILGDGTLARSTSSLKYKKNVEDYTKGLAEVMKLRPVTYNSINKTETQTYAGLIAEEVHDLGLTEFVQYAEDGSPDALAYQNMIALLTKAIQEQQKQIDELKQLVK